jgi:hypothetical protein
MKCSPAYAWSGAVQPRSVKPKPVAGRQKAPGIRVPLEALAAAALGISAIRIPEKGFFSNGAARLILAGVPNPAQRCSDAR